MLFARVRMLAMFVTVAGLAGCVYEPSEVIVQVGTNLPPTVPLRIRIVARRGGDSIAPGTRPDHEWTRFVRDGGMAPDGGVSLPASFAIVPPAGEPRDTLVTLVVEGVTDHETLRRIVRFRIIPQQRTTIAVFLSAFCLGEDTRCQRASPCTRQAYCEETGETCGDQGSCIPVMQNPSRDAGLPDGCVPYCQHARCGDPDGCGGLCATGTCEDNAVCESGVCACATGDARCGSTCMPMSAIACQPGTTRIQDCGSCGSQSATCGTDCQWSAWSTCAGTGCMPGDTQQQACGNCGTQTRMCVSTCTWSGWSTCTGTGCMPGDTQRQACGNCGTQSRTCGTGCNWSTWSGCGGQGCAPGSTQRGSCDTCAHQTCTASCTWSGCSLNAGAACMHNGGTNSRSCAACACGRQYCLSSCVWSTGCVSFCNGMNSGACRTSCTGC